MSEPALNRGKEGVYTSLEVNRGLNALRLLRHFDKSPGGFRVKDKLRARVRWSVGNVLASPPGIGAYDVVLCRNVVIYFNPQDRQRAAQNLRRAVRPTGYVGMGTGESFLPANFAPGWHCCMDKGA